jgi:hypothetical protein
VEKAPFLSCFVNMWKTYCFLTPQLALDKAIITAKREGENNKDKQLIFNLAYKYDLTNEHYEKKRHQHFVPVAGIIRVNDKLVL